MTEKLRAAARQALEALEFEVDGWEYPPPKTTAAITALREALAEPEPRNQCGETCERAKLCAICARGIVEAEQQEPAAWMVYTLDGASVCVTDNPADFTDEHRALPLYTEPFPTDEALLREGWRRCAIGQRTTQYCAEAVLQRQKVDALFAAGVRLAAELERLLLETQDTAAHEALGQWRQAVRAMEAAMDAAQPQASTTLEEADSHARICSKLAEEHKDDALLFAALTDAAAIIRDLMLMTSYANKRRFVAGEK